MWADSKNWTSAILLKKWGLLKLDFHKKYYFPVKSNYIILLPNNIRNFSQSFIAIALEPKKNITQSLS